VKSGCGRATPGQPAELGRAAAGNGRGLPPLV